MKVAATLMALCEDVVADSLTVLQGTLRASSKLHDLLFHKVLRCPMTFFDTVPTARILTRFSKDMDEGRGVDVSDPDQAPWPLT